MALSYHSCLSFVWIVSFPLVSVTLSILKCATPALGGPVAERIITDYNDVIKGVQVDFRYNESSFTKSPPKGYWQSVPGCPKSVEGVYPWVYFGSPRRCYLAGEQGPCDFAQKLFIERGSSVGYCNCECFGEIGTWNVGSKADQPRFCSKSGSEFVFLPKTKKCFKIYDQGPCKKDEWIVKLDNSSSKTQVQATRCEKRICPEGQVPLGQPPKKSSCGQPYVPYAGPVSIQPNECENSGMKYSDLLQKCVRKFSTPGLG